MEGFQENLSKKDKAVVQIQVFAFSLNKSFQRFSHPSLPGTREKSLQMEIYTINVIFSYKQ